MLVSVAWAQDRQDNQPEQNAQETVTIPESEFDALKARLDQLEKDIAELKGAQGPESTATPEPAATAPGGGGKQPTLPDISLVVQATGKANDDKLDPDRQKVQLSEAELGIQGYVYPNVKADSPCSIPRRHRRREYAPNGGTCCSS
jgi:hypothetical protein